MSPSRRALFGLLAGGVAGAGWSAAQACSYSLQDCRDYRRDLRKGLTRVRAVVESSTLATRLDGDDFEYAQVADFTARTTEVVDGLAGVNRVYQGRARAFDCGGTLLGYIPRVGEEVILTLKHDRASGEWTVAALDSAERYDRMAARCT